MLQRAFHISLARRHDARAWEQLEGEIAAVLERTEALHPAEWFVQADGRLKASVAALLGRQGAKSSRVSHYGRAAGQVYESALAWGAHLDDATLGYWRHSALIWITLWHLADVPDISADMARGCLDSAFRQQGVTSDPVLASPAKKAARWKISDSLGSAFRKDA
jgi:hypothetical protein